jgi:DNA-binding response OmpR family regulator
VNFDDPAYDLSPSVLVVDDDPNMRYVITSILEDEGFTLSSAADGQVAIEMAERESPQLVVLDMSLPILGGREVAVRLRAIRGASLPILVITADGRAAEKAREIGAYAYLRKPFELTDLVATVRRGFDQSRVS